MNMLNRWNAGERFVPGLIRNVDDLLGALLGGTEFQLGAELMPDNGGAPRAEVQTGADAVTVRLALPGCSRDDITLEIVGDLLTIRAERSSKEEEKDPGGHFLRRERVFGHFEESLQLPVPVRGADAAAESRDGVLTITLPREKEEAPRTHIVKVN